MHRLASALVCALAIAGCRPTQLSGRSVGQYAVSGALAETTCGEGHPAPPAFSFYVELREEPGSSVGYWKLADGPLVGGSLDREGAFRFEQRLQVVGVPEDAELGVVGCVVERLEIVEGRLEGEVLDAGQADAGRADAGQADAGQTDAGASDATHARLRGETRISVSAVSGDCSPLLLPLGGAFPTLPCALRYTLDGEQLDEPLW